MTEVKTPMNIVQLEKPARALVYCPICTHTVEAEAVVQAKKPRTVPGQKCARCSSSLDAGLVVQFRNAA
jgi:hypothetical protein